MNRQSAIHRPTLASGVRYRWDALRGQHQLLFPEGILVLNPTGAAIVQLCDGRSMEKLLTELRQRFTDGDVESDLHDFLNRLAKKGLLRDGLDD